jgi:hypothetical protein
MNWLKFAFWLCGIYIAYYSALILYDYLRGIKFMANDEAVELTFMEHEQPVLVTPELQRTSLPVTSVVSSGGVSLKQLYRLAQEDAIEYIQAVSF